MFTVCQGSHGIAEASVKGTFTRTNWDGPIIAMDDNATLYSLDQTQDREAGYRLTRWESKDQGFDTGQILSESNIDAFCLFQESKMVIARNGTILVCNISSSRINYWGDTIYPIITIAVWRCIGFHAGCAGLCGGTGNRIYSWTQQGTGIKRHNQEHPRQHCRTRHWNLRAGTLLPHRHPK